MIRRPTDDGIALIPQTAHARLAAQLAAAVGNETFSAPMPRAAVLSAVELHDEGWAAHDAAPTVNAAGEPTDTFEMPLEAALPIWAASTEVAGARDPYAGLLVSLHGMGLSNRAQTEQRSELFALIKFQHAQIETQENLRRRLGMRVDAPLRNGLAGAGRSEAEDLLIQNFLLLEFADQMSLNLCYDRCRFEKIELAAKPGTPATALHIERVVAGQFRVDPWPFERAILHLQVNELCLPCPRYAGATELLAALSATANQTREVDIRGI